MLKHYLKIALRNLIRHKGISFINIFGLTIGMTCAILILLWVGQQFSYDQGQINKDRIVRLENETWVVMPPYLRETALAFPEVEHAARFYYWWEPIVNYNKNIFTLKNVALVDSTVFHIFNFDFIAGNQSLALTTPFSIVLTESISKKIFGNENPIGKTIRVDNELDYHVTAVIKDIERLHVTANAFIAMSDMTVMGVTDGGNDFVKARTFNHTTYLLLKPNVDRENLIAKINERARSVDHYTNKDDLILRPFNDIYFNNNLQYEHGTLHGNKNVVIIFSIVALLILGIACINFVNLTIAKTSTREKEIAVRKVTGAKQSSIQFQFFGETFTIVLISFFIALALVDLLLPWFSGLTSENINIASLSNQFIMITLGVLFTTGFISGIYPSFYLSVLEPVLILKGKSAKGRKGSSLSRILIAFQFSISIFLIIGVLTVFKQLSFMQNTDLGIDVNKVLTCNLKGDRFAGTDEERISARQSFTDKLEANPSIKGVTYLHHLPGKLGNTYSIYDHDPDKQFLVKVFNAYPEFTEMMGLKLLEGRTFSYERTADIRTGYILNEAAAKKLGIGDVVGKFINSGEKEVIGVVKDFHYNSLHSEIEPVIIRWDTWARNACIKIAGNNIPETIKYIESVYKEFCPNVGFEYDFIDDFFAADYYKDQQLETILTYFVTLAILLSCLGLFALTALVAQQRVKEIGIRKVLGSTNSGIIKLISQSFLIWILISNIIAWPAAYFILQGWLETFAYRIDQNFTVYLAGALLSLLIAFITITTQAYKAAIANPVDSLRNE